MLHEDDDSDNCDWYEGFADEVEGGHSQDDEPVWTPPQFDLKSILGLVVLLAIICSLSATLGTDAQARMVNVFGMIVVGSFLFVVGLLISGLVRLVKCGDAVAEPPRRRSPLPTGEAMGQIENDNEKCVCPHCHVDVAEDATQCPECGEMFPSMADRRGLTTTPEFYDAIRTLVLVAAIIIAAGSVLGGLVSFIAGRP